MWKSRRLRGLSTSRSRKCDRQDCKWNKTLSWAPSLGNVAVQAVDESPGAVFKGLVFGTNKSGTFLFVTNFRGATVEVFAPNGSTGYQRVGAFTDTGIPAGYAPFGLHNINGMLFVTYAQQDAKLHDDVPGQGHGFVDVFDTNGNLIQRFAQHGQLNSPWGVVQASMAFGDFSSDILVGNFGDGTINAYDAKRGNFVGTVRGHEQQAAGDRWTVVTDAGRW